MDIWIIDECLMKHAFKDVDPEDIERRVADYWEQHIGWNWEKLDDFLPEHVIRRLTSYILVDEEEQKDDVCWRNEPSCMISVSSVYNTIHGHAGTIEHSTKDSIWRLKVPSRVKTFVWLSYYQRVMTNDMRNKRGFTTTDICHRCRGVREDIGHILRTCPDANRLWMAIALEFAKRNRWKKPFMEWMSDNVKSREMTSDNLEWRMVFTIGAWWLWKWWNEEVFRNMNRSLYYKANWIRR